MISIIIPVYNAEKYLCECIDSILAQTYKDFELLLIDDGSTDGSGEICDEYALKVEGLGMRGEGNSFHKSSSINHKPSIRVFHKENGGVSSARNMGLENAQGEWICFVDADDTIPADALDTFAKAANEEVDLVMTKYQSWNEEGELTAVYKMYSDCILSTKQFIGDTYILSDRGYQGFIWNKLFRHSIIIEKHLRFNKDIHFNEDRLFIVQFACASGKDIVYKDHLTYNYVERSTGAMASLKTSYNKRFVTDFDAMVLMKKTIDRLPIGKSLRAKSIEGICKSFDWNMRLMIQFSDYSLRNHCHMLWSMLKCGAFLPQLKKSIYPIASMLFPFIYTLRKHIKS